MNNTTFQAHSNGITKAIRPITVSIHSTNNGMKNYSTGCRILSNNYVIAGIRFY